MLRLVSDAMSKAFGAVVISALVMRSLVASDVQPMNSAIAVVAAAMAGAMLRRLSSRHHAVLVGVMVGWLLAIVMTPLLRGTGSAWTSIASFVFGAPCAVLAMTFVGRRVGRASASSVLDRAARRALVATTAAVIALAASLTLAAEMHQALVPEIFAAGALLTILVAMARELRALAATKRARPDADGKLDFGMGEVREERREEVPASYRTSAVVVTVTHGSRGPALRLVGLALAIELGALAVASTGFAFALAAHAAHAAHADHVAEATPPPLRPCVRAPRAE